MALTSEIRDKKILSMYPVSGGDINSAFQLTLVDGTQLFMKRNSLPFFELEAKGLEAIRNTKTIRVPKVIEAGNDGEYYLLLEWIEPGLRVSGFWETFGHELAAMHRAPGFSSFGWTSDNYIGARPQINTQSDKWIPFFRDYRLTPQFKSAQHYFDASDWKRITRLLDHLDDKDHEAWLSHVKVMITASRKPIWLVLVYGITEHPMMLATSIPICSKDDVVRVAKLYFSRWRIEEYFRCKKTAFEFENFRVRSLKAINALNFYMTICMAYLAFLSLKPQSNQIRCNVIEAADPIKNTSFFSVIAWLLV